MPRPHPAGAAGILSRVARRTARRTARRALAVFALAGAVAAAVTLGAAPAAAQPWSGAPLGDTLAGRSGQLRARWVLPTGSGLFAYLRRLVGDSVADDGVRPGVYEAPTADAPERRPFAYITMLPFAEKVDGRIGRYRIGFWPGELGRALRGRGGADAAGKYAPPAGFIQVTRANAGTLVSEHFRLADFLTHDQAAVWPKYLVLDAALVDKLELVLQDLRARGYPAERLYVMSGFRTPRYNRSGGDPRGRSALSRHQYGDAADVWVENGAGRMADLTGDGRVDARDADVLAAAVDRVEGRHPTLVGGMGVYGGGRVHGPFVHVDTRGSRARWLGAG